MFEFAARRVDAGLLTPTVAVCYGGELDEMRALPGYTTLRDACGANNIEMFESVMSLTAWSTSARAPWSSASPPRRTSSASPGPRGHPVLVGAVSAESSWRPRRHPTK